MDPKRTTLAIILVFGASALADTRAHAQTFSELSASAREVSREIDALAAPLFASCDALVGRSRELCATNLERASAEIDGATLLVSMPASERVVIGPYEPRGGGFRVAIPGFQVVRSTGGVVVVRPADRAGGSRARRRGAAPPRMLAEAFVRVSAADAREWAERNAIERLRLRLVLRFGEPYDTPSPRAAERRAVAAEVLATQVYNESAGNVLVDSTEPPAELPEAPKLLDRRASLWTVRRQREVLWRTPDGDALLFHVRAEPAPAPARGVVPIILATRRADPEELTRFTAVAPEAAVDLVPHGRGGVLVVVTEQRSRRRAPGRGQVIYLRWNAARSRVEVVARWRGSNEEAPPAWVRDPDAPLPEASAATSLGPT